MIRFLSKIPWFMPSSDEPKKDRPIGQACSSYCRTDIVCSQERQQHLVLLIPEIVNGGHNASS